MDKLFLLKPGFTNPIYPQRRFYCWHCALIEGVLATYPELERKIEVHRIAWPRPRQELVDLAGLENQSVPLLALADGRGLLADKDAILRYLAEQYGIDEPHPS